MDKQVKYTGKYERILSSVVLLMDRWGHSECLQALKLSVLLPGCAVCTVCLCGAVVSAGILSRVNMFTHEWEGKVNTFLSVLLRGQKGWRAVTLHWVIKASQITFQSECFVWKLIKIGSSENWAQTQHLHRNPLFPPAEDLLYLDLSYWTKLRAILS